MTNTEFSRNFLIKYYPTRGKTWNNKLIGLSKMKEIIADDEVFESQFKRIEEFAGDVLEIKLRRGIRFKIVSR